MYNDCSDDNGALPKLNKMQKNHIDGESGNQLSTSITVFSTWMLSELKPGLYGQKRSRWSPEVMSNTIGKFCVMLEIIFFFLYVTKESEV